MQIKIRKYLIDNKETEIDYKRVIDDTAWNTYNSSTSDSTVKMLNNYFMNRNIMNMEEQNQTKLELENLNHNVKKCLHHSKIMKRK